ncbi:MAG: amidohydrolase family protein [Anaerolineae bacterium]|nr:amidohydrolase family protein [Chloroflexota bacterium]
MPERNLSSIRADVDALPVYSDHEHHLPDSFFTEGMSLDKSLSRTYVAWTGFVPDSGPASRAALLDNVRYNSYFVWYERGLQRMHGITEPLTMENWEYISGIVSKNHRQNPDLHWQALLNNGYERLIQDAYWNPGDDMGHPEAFVPTFRIDKFLYGYHPDQVAPDDIYPWELYGFEGGTLDDYIACLRETVKRRHAAGLVAALKCAEAYNRRLDFDQDDRAAAEAAFGRPPELVSSEARRLFSNYVFNRCCELAAELQVPFQIHTGLGHLGGSNPMLLLPVLERHADTRFVLFHTGYPWIAEAAGLAHNYANVISSLTWTATISTTTAVRALQELLDVARSVNRITWGSDCWVPEESIGAQLAWRHVVAQALTERYEQGTLRAADVQPLACKLLFENNRNIYGAID